MVRKAGVINILHTLKQSQKISSVPLLMRIESDVKTWFIFWFWLQSNELRLKKIWFRSNLSRRSDEWSSSNRITGADYVYISVIWFTTSIKLYYYMKQRARVCTTASTFWKGTCVFLSSKYKLSMKRQFVWAYFLGNDQVRILQCRPDRRTWEYQFYIERSKLLV